MNLDPNNAVELYKKHGYRPCRNNVNNKFNDNTCCVLGILYYDEVGSWPNDPDVIYNWAAKKIKYDIMTNIWTGFDNPECFFEETPNIGYVFGRDSNIACRKVFGDF